VTPKPINPPPSPILVERGPLSNGGPSSQGGSSGGSGGSNGPQKGPHICQLSSVDPKASGPVSYKYSEFSATAGGTSGDAAGTFQTSKGYSGVFHTTFDGVAAGGKGIGVSYGGGTSASLATFAGANINVVGTLGPDAISDNFDVGTGDLVGETDALSTLGIMLGLTVSHTTILILICPK
jgi:hypothetical protein